MLASVTVKRNANFAGRTSLNEQCTTFMIIIKDKVFTFHGVP